MAFAPGTKLGVCEVTAQIRAGGMDEVHKAHDPTRQRMVALTVLAKQDEDAFS